MDDVPSRRSDAADATPPDRDIRREAYEEAMTRLSGRSSSLDRRTPEEWATLNRVLMDDGPVDIGDPRTAPRRRGLDA